MLPEDKNEFPKCLYLDQNFWIGLAQAATGHPDGKRFEPSLLAVRRSVDSGNLVTPLSLVHIIEASIPGREDRRENLMGFMLALSKGKSFAHYKHVRPIEIENAIRRWYNVDELRAVRPSVVGDWAGITTGADPDLSKVPAEWLPLVESVIRSAAVFQSVFMAVSDDREAIKNAVAQEVAGADQLQQIRERAQANLTDRQREVLNYAGMFREGAITDELVAALGNGGVPLERWCEEIMAKPDELVRFSEDIPFIDVFVRLNLLHSRNTSRVYGRNDVRDLVWLAVALPYSNVIAGETYWTTLAAPLGAKYSTTLVNQPEALPDALAAAGC